MVAARRILLADDHVVVDYRESDLEILELVGQHVGRVAVLPTARDVLGSGPRPSLEHDPFGIRVVDVDPALVLRATEVRGNASFNERLCLVTCREEGWPYVTNDGAIRRLFERHRVETRFGLDLLLDLVAVGAITHERAHGVASAIHALNPWQITERALNSFVRSLDTLVPVQVYDPRH